MSRIDCHYGDHNYNSGAYCADCGKFNAGMLVWAREEKAIREGRYHYGHYHRTVEAKERCTRKPEPEWIEAYGDSEVPV